MKNILKKTKTFMRLTIIIIFSVTSMFGMHTRIKHPCEQCNLVLYGKYNKVLFSMLIHGETVHKQNNHIADHMKNRKRKKQYSSDESFENNSEESGQENFYKKKYQPTQKKRIPKSTVYFLVENPTIAQCPHCPQIYRGAYGSQNIAAHVKNIHECCKICGQIHNSQSDAIKCRKDNKK